MFPGLEVLDQLNRDGEEVLTDEEDDDDYGAESGEDDIDPDDENDILANMTEEQKEKLREQGIDINNYLQGDEEDFDEEYGEEDLSEGYGDEEGSVP